MNSYKISETKQTQHLAHCKVTQSTHITLLNDTANSAVLQLAHTELFNIAVGQQCISTIRMITLLAHNNASAYYSQCATLLTTYTDQSA